MSEETIVGDECSPKASTALGHILVDEIKASGLPFPSKWSNMTSDAQAKWNAIAQKVVDASLNEYRRLINCDASIPYQMPDLIGPQDYDSSPEHL